MQHPCLRVESHLFRMMAIVRRMAVLKISLHFSNVKAHTLRRSKENGSVSFE